jgi:AcrR family transcriptional regulator
MLKSIDLAARSWFDDGMPAVASSTQEQIVLAAERLFAQHGIDGVSLRQLGAAAGNSNNSAVQYHFGSKDTLAAAIFGYRWPRLDERRTLLIAERRPRDLRGFVECLLLAILEQGELPGSHYLRFVAMLHQHGRRDILLSLPEEHQQASRAFHERLAGYLTHLPAPLRAHRIGQALAFAVRAGADREMAHAEGLPMLDFAVEATDLIDGITGFLLAPASPQTLAALEEAGPPRVASTLYL